MAEPAVEVAARDDDTTPRMDDTGWNPSPWADQTGHPHPTKSGWSRVINCLNCAVNSEILARLAPSDHQLPSLVDENKLCGWNPEDSECLRNACVGDCFRDVSDTTHDKDGSPPLTKSKRNRQRRTLPGNRELKAYPFHHHKDLQEYMREYRQDRTVKWQMPYGKTSETNVLACKIFQWSHVFPNDGIVVASPSGKMSRQSNAKSRKEARSYLTTSEGEVAPIIKIKEKPYVAPGSEQPTTPVLPSESDRKSNHRDQNMTTVVWSYRYSKSLQNQHRDKHDSRSSPDIRVQSDMKPNDWVAQTYSDSGKLAGVNKAESLSGGVQTGTPSNTPATALETGSNKTPKRRQKQEATVQQIPLNVFHNSPRFSADCKHYFRPRDSVFVRPARKARAAASRPHSKTRSPSQTTYVVTAASGAWVIPTTSIGDAKHPLHKITAAQAATLSAGPHDRRQAELRRHLQTCVFPRLSTKAASKDVNNAKRCQNITRDDVRQVVHLGDVIMASKILSKSMR